MISRRNIRVKVMQTLYTLDALENDVTAMEAQKLLLRHFDQSKDLVQYLLYFITELGMYAETDSYSRSHKHLPSPEDLNVNIKIAGNEWLWKLKEEPSIKAEWASFKPQHRIDKDLLRKLYNQLTETDIYQRYINSPSREKGAEKEIVFYLFETLLLGNEDFVAHLEEQYTNWEDDGEMVIQLVRGILQKPGAAALNPFVSADKLQFAKSLLATVREKKEHLETFILPKLKNWDAERLATLDLILMKMGVAELLYFETIPPKVTINEYIELAKEYSTDQSGQFVNGILDNIHKDLVDSGKLQKTEFRKA